MTIAINLAQQTHVEYQGVWKRALIQAFKLYPDINEIANLISGSRGEYDSVLKLMVPIDTSKIHERIRFMDFSGAGAYRFWMLAAKEQYKMSAGPTMTLRTQKEMLTQAVWGTQKEALSIMGYWPYIPNKKVNWQTVTGNRRRS